MRLKKYEDMNLQELDVMKEISSIGTSHAATALSKLLQKEIRISIPESFEELDELAYSALEEVGNIIICSYVNAFTQLVGVEIDLSVPSSTVNMLGGVLTVPMAEYGYVTDKLMYINAEFIVDGKKLSDGLLMLPDIESLNRILEKLGVS